MEGNFQKNDATTVSRSSEPFIQIDSIFIDLITSDDKIDCGKCEHFSIRRFVSETRKKDWKMCWPFALDGDRESDDQTPLLPPLEIPNFSWWRCPNCQREISSKDFHQVPKSDTMDKRLIAISNSTNLSDNCNPSLCTGVRRKRAEVICSVTGNVIGSEEEVNMGVHLLSSLAPKIKSSVVLERCINNNVAPKPESKGSRESRQSGRGSCKFGEVELSVMNLKVDGENHVENLQTGKQTSVGNDCKILCQASEFGRVVHKAHNAVTVRDQSKSYPSLEVNGRKLSASELGELSASEFVELSAGNDIHDSHVHKSNGSCRRKIRKHRLLTELLGEDRSMKNKQVEVAADTLSNGTSDASTGPDTLYVPSSQVVIQGNSSKSSGQSRKRKMSRDEEWRPREINSCYKNRKFQALTEGVKTNDSLMSSKFENPYGQTGRQTMKSLTGKSRFNGDHMSGRKKYKKPKVPNPGFSLLQSRENVQQEIQENHASAYSWMDSFSFTDARMKSKSSMCKKKSDMQFKEAMGPPFFGDKDLLMPYSTARKNAETIEPIPFQLRKDEFSERRLDLSLSSYMAAQRMDTTCVPQGVDGLSSFQPQQGGTFGVSQFSRKEVESSRPPDALDTQGMHCQLNKKVNTYRMPFPIEIQQLTPQFEDSVCFRLQRMDIASPSSCTKNIEVQECIAMKKKQNDNMYEKGSVDDIPMEIVELMAKNQFEREIHDAENKIRLSETNTNMRNPPMAYCGNSRSNASSSRDKNKINGVIIAKEVVGPKKQSSVDYLSHISGYHFNTNHLQQMHSSEGYGRAITQSQKKPSSGIQYSAAGPSKFGSAQNENYGGIMEDPGSSHPRMHVFGGCREHLPVPLQNEERALICPQVALNHLQCGYNNNPQKGSFKSKKAGKVSNGHISMDKGNLSYNENSINIETKNRAYSLQGLSRKNAECPYSYQSSGVEIHKNTMNSLDLCSNETIPAMHLLSLMDAGMKSTPPFSPAGMSKLPKKSSPFLQNLKPNEFSGFDLVSNNKIDTVRFQAHPWQKSPDFLPVGSVLGASTSSQQGQGFINTSNFNGKFGSKLQKKETEKRSVQTPWNRSRKLKKSVVTSDGTGSGKNGALPVHHVRNSFFDPADSTLVKMGCQRKNKVSQLILEDHGSNAMLMAMKRPIESGVCTINRNPSDFSLPEAGNMYTIGADDLKFGQHGSNISHGRKRKKNVKHNAVKECARRPILS